MMDGEIRDELRNTVSRFVAEKCTDELVDRWDEDGDLPSGLLSDIAKLGWTGLAISEEYGGSGSGVTELLIVAEELAKASFDIASALGLTIFTAMNLERHATTSLKERLLPSVCSGDLRFAVGLTEPGSGSDASALQSRGRLDGDEIVISGQKIFCSGAHLPGTIIAVACRTRDSRRRQDGISVVLVPNDTKGVTVQGIPTLGRRLARTNSVFFDDVKVPASNLVGAIDEGWQIVTSGLMIERLYVTAGYLGSTATLLRLAVDYGLSRQQFGRSIAEFQSIAHTMANVSTDLAAARALTYSTADAFDRGIATQGMVSKAKLFCSELWYRAADMAMHVFGGYGYVNGTTVQRHFRDSRVGTITAGSSEIQRTIIARELGIRS